MKCFYIKPTDSLILDGTTTTTTVIPTTGSSSQSSDFATAQTTTQIPERPSEIPITPPSNDIPGTATIPTPDPYFTHFDPRMEHQSYKVGQDVKNLLSNSQ